MTAENFTGLYLYQKLNFIQVMRTFKNLEIGKVEKMRFGDVINYFFISVVNKEM